MHSKNVALNKQQKVIKQEDIFSVKRQTHINWEQKWRHTPNSHSAITQAGLFIWKKNTQKKQIKLKIKNLCLEKI